jgi:hypothetical protein
MRCASAILCIALRVLFGSDVCASKDEGNDAGAGNLLKAFETLAPHGDACWAMSWSDEAAERGKFIRHESDAAVFLLPLDRSFVACNPAASMDVRFALTQASITSIVRDHENVALYLDGVLLWEKTPDELQDFLPSGRELSSVSSGGKDGAVIALTIPLKGGNVGIDLSLPFHVVEVTVGEALNSQTSFRLELSSVEPFGCSRSASVQPAFADAGSVDDSEWYLPAEAAAYGQDEARVFSQNGEDGVLSAILEELGFPSVLVLAREKLKGSTDRPESAPSAPEGLGVYVEIGAGDGSECNTRILREAGWKGLTFDSGNDKPEIDLYRAFVTGQNVNQLISAHRHVIGHGELDVLRCVCVGA